MYEVDVLAVGEKSRSGDAIALRFSRPDGNGVAHGVIDAGFQSSGDGVVDFVKSRYGTDAIDFAILTHPDGDHIGGMGSVIRELDVGWLLLHRLADHGGADLRASRAVDELCDLAEDRGTNVYDAFQGMYAFGGALLVAGPTQAYYEDLVVEQLQEEQRESSATATRSFLSEAVQKMVARVLTAFPIETDFDDAGGVNARNNSSMIIDLRLGEQRLFFPGDAGVPAINAALDFLDTQGRNDVYPEFIAVPHHGSRHNLDRETIERLAGPATDDRRRTAFVSIAKLAAEDARYPSPRVTNAFGRRGYFVGQTAGQNIWKPGSDAPPRPDYSALSPVPAKDEAIDDR